MSENLKDVTNDLNYDKEASAESKATAFVFVGTFLWGIFFTDASPGIIFGAIFFFLGMFVNSIVITMPFFILRKKFPNFTLILNILSFAATIFVTYTAFQFLFG